MKKQIEKWKDKLIDLVELELEKCPQKKGECYMNDILHLVKTQLTTEYKRGLLEGNRIHIHEAITTTDNIEKEIISEFIKGKRCFHCGKLKERGLSDWCGKCLEEA